MLNESLRAIPHVSHVESHVAMYLYLYFDALAWSNHNTRRWLIARRLRCKSQCAVYQGL